MEVHVTQQDDNTTVLEVVGRIDANTHKELQQVVSKLDCANQRLVFDFRDVSYISSAGLRVIMTAAKKVAGGSLSIINVNDVVYDIFHAVGYDALFDVRLNSGGVTFVSSSFKEILSSYAQRFPQVKIVSHLGKDYTWEMLNACAQIVANDLYTQGVRRGSHVGICSANSANWIIAFFAIQKIGGIACLMNYNYSAAEIASVSSAGDITFLCYGEISTMGDNADAFLQEVQAADGNMIESFYDIRSSIDFTERIDEYDALRGLFHTKVEVDDVCVMIYTSGSTGTPKGVLLSAYNILNASQAMSDEIMIDENDRLCLIIPLFHIFGMTAGLFCNAMRNALIVIPKSIRTSVLLKTLSEYECTLFHSVPTMMLAIMNNKGFSSDKVESLRCTILAGAPITPTQTQKMYEMFPNTHFVGAYGLSEMAPVSMTMYDDTMENVATTVGIPISNIQIAVVDSQTGIDCDPGVSGEIIVEGYNLMCSYYKVPLELQSVDDAGWLHTGDLGFFDEEGYLHISGRSKELIIRGGENIMPAEIEDAISAFPQVADVKVQGVPDDFFGEVVGASIVMRGSAALDVDALLEFLRERLAKYKLPAYVFQYDKFPMLSNGKVDAVELKRSMNAKAAALKQEK